MRRGFQYALAFTLAVVLTAGVVGAGWAVPTNPYTGPVQDYIWPYSNQLTATVTNNLDGSYHYNYTLEFIQTSLGGFPLTDFSVGNPSNLPFTNPGCTYAFTMATNSQDSVYWYIDFGTATVGHPVSFWFDSVYSYGLADVTVVAGLPSNGTTLGMVPEPCSIAVMVLGSGALWTRLKRRRR